MDIALLMSGCVGKTKRGRPSHMGRPAPKDTIFSPPFNNSLSPYVVVRPTRTTVLLSDTHTITEVVIVSYTSNTISIYIHISIYSIYLYRSRIAFT